MHVLFEGIGIMPESKRQCSKCQFFQVAQLPGNGWCTHPKRQVASDVKILVREKELACRNSWGDDLWVDAATTGAKPDVVSPPRKGLFYVTNRVDDEVTSVVDTTTKALKSAGELRVGRADDVVTHTTVRHDDPTARPGAKLSKPNDLNAPANADQAERARLMARGNRDAIQKARERHTERRNPVRELIVPDGAETNSDRILAAQHREQYSQGTNDDQRSSIDAYRSTPPVPREEVQAKGNSLSPASGSDKRFDTVAAVKPEVNLTQLRGFLNRAGTSHRGASKSSPGEATVVTSYDLVLQRAQEIKAASDIEHAYRRPSPENRKASKAATDPPPPASPEPLPDHANPGGPSKPIGRLRKWAGQAPQSYADHDMMGHDNLDEPLIPRRQPNVVWDVEGERLSIAFERARMAIDHPVHPSAAPLNITHLVDDLPPPTDRQRVSGRPAAGWTEGLDPDAPDDATDQFAADDDGGEERVGNSAYWAEDEPADAGYGSGDYKHRSPSAPVESPRGSWWRSLNFGLKRRYRSEPVNVYPFAYDDDVAAEDAYVDADAEDPVFPEPIRHEEAKVYAASGVEREGRPLQSNQAVHSDEPIIATSKASWTQDEREFPEPQPAEWHETRTRLLQHAPEPFAGLDSPASVSSQYPSLHVYAARADEENAFHGEQHVELAPVRRVSPSFAFDQPSGMDAFRAALFDDRHQAPIEDGFVRQGVMSFAAAAEPPRRQGTRSSLTLEPDPGAGDRRTLRSRHESGGIVVQHRPDRAAPSSTYLQPQRTLDSDFDIRDAIEDQDADYQRHFEVASRVPKSCSTCRSFRPSDNGERGWCMNDFSATHRQMVNSDDLACRSSIGDWWLAADTSWIPPTDVITPKTPRTDRLVARSSPPGAVAPPRGRRVRTSKVG